MVVNASQGVSLGINPGISDDGRGISYSRSFVSVPGRLYLAVRNNKGEIIKNEQIAGLDAELGYDDSGNAIKFREFDSASRISVTHLELEEPDIIGDSFVVSFVGTPKSASRNNPAISGTPPLFFSAEKGLWTVRVDVMTELTGTKKLVLHSASPIKVVQVGDKIGDIVVSDFGVYDSLANVAYERNGAIRTQRRGDHQIVFWVRDATGRMAIVRGVHLDSDQDGLLDHWETRGIDMDGDGPVDLDLYAMGADPKLRDIFLEIDWLADRNDGINRTYSFAPAPGVTERLAAMFADAPALVKLYGYRADGTDPEEIPKGITLHVDAGPGKDAKGKPYSIGHKLRVVRLCQIV
jgi:hypothetical protein